MNHEDLTYRIIGCAMRIHSVLGAGFLESVYHRAMEHELRKAGIEFESEYPLKVYYDSQLVGRFSADLFVENCLLVELKAVLKLNHSHTAQLVNYLSATEVDDGLLINFGSSKLDYKRKFRTYRPSSSKTGLEHNNP